MTIWELMKSRHEDFTAYDDTVDAVVECIDFNYDPNEGDGYNDFLYELYSRVEITDPPSYNANTLNADFYGFIEKNIDIFNKHFVLEDDDPAALMTEYINDVCAGGVSDKLCGEIAKDLAKLPKPQEQGKDISI